MRGFLSVILLFVCVAAASAQSRVGADTLRRELPTALPQSPESPQPKVELRMQEDKPWLDFDDAMPSVFGTHEAVPTAAQKNGYYTLHPYTTTTPYDWDPVYQKKIAVNADTWRGAYWRSLGVSDIKGMTPSGYIKRKEYSDGKVYFENGALVGDWATLLTQYFTCEYWRFRDKKNRRVSLELLRNYNKLDTEAGN